MPSPFPGMNPYLEQAGVWKDFHDTFIPALRETLLSLVTSAGYYVRIDEALYIRDTRTDEEIRSGRSDLSVWPRDEVAAPAEGNVLATLAPMKRELLPVLDTERIPFLEVVNRQSKRVVTVIELLSPSNKKPGHDRNMYLAKRRNLLSSDVNLVEIDLLRGWLRPPVTDPPQCDYRILVSRAEVRPEVGLWPLDLKDRLPSIPIPLRLGDPEVLVDLQTVFDRVFDGGGYDFVIYEGEPEPPLDEDDLAWAKGLIPSR